MIVLDTTVLVYATGTEHPLRDPCRRLVAAIAAGTVAATTTVEVVQEFVHVRARRRSRPDAAEVGAAYTRLLSPLLSVTTDDLLSGLQLFRSVERLSAFDAVLAAAALSRSARALVSADSAFATVPELSVVFPEASEIDRLLSA